MAATEEASVVFAAPDAARTIVLASGADYLVACPGMNELDLYRFTAPGGLWARLERGERRIGEQWAERRLLRRADRVVVVERRAEFAF